ncbi:agamous-like MADS-box protein AGL82 [Sesamum indicum]|uniref:Agamous-like MADS-box protein AGL82 n=1 Tax=Sesamum indicum TaxID=4182 RepID=A0A6I9UES0_SESIN|nr:agamous-like MADS-box protein AGL82 [Sesamum indicum]
MGRAKLKMELISNERSRTLTFKKRKEGLTRKLREFTTLCDVNACMIIYGPKPEIGPEIWPQNNPDEVRRMIQVYSARNRDSGSKSFGLPDFFNDRKRKLEEEFVKLRRKNLEAKYPTWFEFLNDLSEAQLRDFAVGLKNKAGSVKSRIEFLKCSRNDNPGLEFDQLMMDAARLNQFYNLNQQQQISSVDHHHDHHVQCANQDPLMMMLMMNENNDQLIGAAAGSFDHQDNVFYGMEPTGPVGPVICYGPTPVEQYYTPPPMALPLSLPPPPYIPVMSRLQFSTMENYYHDGAALEDIFQDMIR